MPLIITEAELDRFILESEAFYAKHGKNLWKVPADEAEAQRKREIAIESSSPDRLALACATNRNFQTGEDKALLYGVKPAVTSEPGFDGRRAA